MPNPLQTLIEDSITKGLVEGRQEGKIEGGLEGRQASLRRVLRSRFGTIPDSLEQRIAAATMAELDDLIDRAVLVGHIQDL